MKKIYKSSLFSYAIVLGFMAWSFVPYFLVEGVLGTFVWTFFMMFINYLMLRYIATITLDDKGITLKRCLREKVFVSWDQVTSCQKVHKQRGIHDLHLKLCNNEEFKFSPAAFRKEDELIRNVIKLCKDKVKKERNSLYLVEDMIN